MALCLPDDGAPVTSVGTRRVTFAASCARSAACAGVATNASGCGVTAGAAACESDIELDGPGAAGDVSEGMRPSRKTSCEPETTTTVLPSSAGSNAPRPVPASTAGTDVRARARSSYARTSSTMGRIHGSTPRRRTRTSRPPSTRRLLLSSPDATSSSPNPEGRRSSASAGDAGSAPKIEAYSEAKSAG